MTTGSGIFISPVEKNPLRQNIAIRQLIEGRSNAVGIATLNGNGVATTTVVKAPNCSPSSAVLLFPATLHAAGFLGGTVYVAPATVVAGQFTVTHAATANADVTFWWVCLG